MVWQCRKFCSRAITPPWTAGGGRNPWCEPTGGGRICIKPFVLRQSRSGSSSGKWRKNMDNRSTLKRWIEESHRIVFFGGAGVSTESGIPDFRSQDGLYHQQYDYPPETILSHSFFYANTEEFYRFYRAKMLCLTAKPNRAH